MIKEVTRERIRACLEREFVFAPIDTNVAKVSQVAEPVLSQRGEVRLKLAGLLANYVTTDVNQEPLNGDAFINFSELVKELSGGKSRAVCISHGLRAKRGRAEGDDRVICIDEKAAGRLDLIADRMDDKDLFVLSLDFSRTQGRIADNMSQWSYAETLNRLLPALRKGARITVSIQGNDIRESRHFRAGAENLYTRVKRILKENYNWENEDLMNLHMDTGRAWVNHGRAKSMPGIDPGGESPVIPDSSFVMHTLENGPANMAFLDTVSGGIFVHPHNLRRSYNDVGRLSRWLSARGKLGVNKGEWQEVFVDTETPDLKHLFSREARRSQILQERKNHEQRANGAESFPSSSPDGAA